MIKQLEIKDFLGFGDSSFSGFERVNLLTGLNNSGKTKFLEVLYLKSLGMSSSEKITLPDLAEPAYKDRAIEAFHLIDSSIAGIHALAHSATIYLSRKKQCPTQIDVFGTAINRVADFFLGLINNRSGVLLIDEIENGIHHSSYKRLWQWLFAQAVELDVQIFATTHSLEMITAFRDVTLGTQYESEAAYFEFGRHVKRQNIILIRRNVEDLDYALERKPNDIRGE